MGQPRRRHYLYRVFAVDGRLLYVGETHQSPPSDRVAQHEAGAWWWRFADGAATTVVPVNGGLPVWCWEARRAERMVIEREKPLANIDHNGDRGHRFAAHVFAGGELHGWPPPVEALPVSPGAGVLQVVERFAPYALIGAGLFGVAGLFLYWLAT